MDHVVLTSHALNLSEICDLVADDSCGAISFFVGTTRDNFESKKVLSLEYEAYEPMAVKEIKKICLELRSRWVDIANIAIYHRLGLVKVREASVIIAISSPHRQTALDATAQAIEELKCRVPIWKKEKYEGDDAMWKENKECTWLNKTGHRQFQSLDIPCQNIDDTQDSKNLVQISAPESEIDRRIQSFVKKKREQIDLNNTREFMGIDFDTQSESNSTITCARTDSVIFKQEHSKGHLRVRRARNTIGPQTRPDYLRALDKHMLKTKPILKTTEIDTSDSQRAYKQMNPWFSERLSNAEDFLHIPYAEGKTVHERLKEIENRLLCLEAISPEYKHFLDKPTKLRADSIDEINVEKNKINFAPERKTYTLKQLDDIIKYYEKDYKCGEPQPNYSS